ncbi:putative ubiquitin-conjugating enzyme E2C-binding [Rosellinia necatrix]|uniref:Putative ubiquitin-conjugating enzyme E2C-binding n=1 Tax=Rosellinia necatrix TaxID=77044 RepID=A0A1W2TE71_ROSNE|nr:putative ubiquitin-conjugating enzyme E2C-binding [Rosellinia necatrix]
MPPSRRVLVYAELLSNIRQVSVGCTLPTPASEHTQVAITADGWALTVTHDGSSQTIRLPERVAPFSRLPIKSAAGTSLSWRLPLAAPLSGRALPASEESVPWSAIDLETGSAIVCRTCRSTVVEAGTLVVWKDLPSENWAEMMEFWHCHKPDNHHKHGNDDEHLANRGYGSNSRIEAQAGVGFVDLTSFLVAAPDLVTSLISASESTGGVGGEIKATATTLHCTSCKTQLGVQNAQASSVSIFKWQVIVQQRNRNISKPSPNVAQCVSAMLLATMARSGCSKSIMLPMKVRPGLSVAGSKTENQGQVQGLLNIWLFNANITFSSTEACTSPTNAVKVLYRTINQEEADKMQESITSDVQDVSLPAEGITAIIGLLSRSNGFIPESDRKFKEWTVGLLEKWDSKGG